MNGLKGMWPVKGAAWGGAVLAVCFAPRLKNDMTANIKDTMAWAGCSGVFGVTLGMIGHTFLTWQFWLLLLVFNVSIFICRHTTRAHLVAVVRDSIRDNLYE